MGRRLAPSPAIVNQTSCAEAETVIANIGTIANTASRRRKGLILESGLAETEATADRETVGEVSTNCKRAAQAGLRSHLAPLLRGEVGLRSNPGEGDSPHVRYL